MSLPVPNLDDRDFEQLLAEARQRAVQSAPAWTDMTENDPGIVLLQLFAFLTESLLYRLNRVPEKLYIEFLRLLGVRVQPPSAARAVLRFSRAPGSGMDSAIEIPRGTRITVERSGTGSEPPTFVTAQPLTLAAGESEVEGIAYHGEYVEGEAVGKGTGLPGLTVQVKNPPIVAPTGDALDLVVGVEMSADEENERVPAIRSGEKAYRIWREAEHFTDLGDNRFAYVADRTYGQIFFAPAAALPGDDGGLGAVQALAEVPAQGREIRVWYRRGGGPAGNVGAGALKMMRDAIPGLEVSNPAPAVGGRAVETLENALVRGPQRLHALERAVTARDYELIALNSSRAIARARAFTRAAIWSFAAPGTVEVLLVPHLPDEDPAAATVARLTEHQSEDTRLQLQRVLDERRPLGTRIMVTWARYKSVQVTCRIVVRREEDRAAVRRRVLDRLYWTIRPLPSENGSGWPFGQALRASHVYDIALAEPGVRWVDSVQFRVEEVPDQNVTRLTADPHQPATWYAGAGPTLFRTVNDGAGWEAIGRFPEESIVAIATHAQWPGLLAVASTVQNETGFESRLRFSEDCGETWKPMVLRPAVQVHDLAWVMRGNAPFLLAATGKGLFALRYAPNSNLEPVQVDRADADQAFYAIAAHTNAEGVVNVALAAENLGGVYISPDAGTSGSFRKIGLNGQDIRILRVQQEGSRAFLWAGAAATGEAPGTGASRWELRGRQDAPEGWQAFATGWTGGSLRDLAFAAGKVFAASFRAGVFRLEPDRANTGWQASNVRSGLPMRDPGRFHPVYTVAARPEEDFVLAGGAEGIFATRDGGETYASVSARVFTEKVTLPDTWLFVSGEHDVQVVGDDEAD